MTPNGLEQYHELFEDEENLQNKWEAAVVHPKLGVDLLIGQLGDDDIRAIDAEENFCDTGHYDEMKNFFSCLIPCPSAQAVFGRKSG